MVFLDLNVCYFLLRLFTKGPVDARGVTVMATGSKGAAMLPQNSYPEGASHYTQRSKDHPLIPEQVS